MENLRAFMLVTEIRGICGEDDFTFFPPNVEGEPETAGTIISQGFLLSFRNADVRDKAAKVAASSGSVKGYQTSDEQAEPEAPAKTAGASAPQKRLPARLRTPLPTYGKTARHSRGSTSGKILSAST